jgi:hypothetical protein
MALDPAATSAAPTKTWVTIRQSVVPLDAKMAPTATVMTAMPESLGLINAR